MKLFLSSSKVGEELEKLPLLVKNKRAVLIPNALDDLNDKTLYQEKIEWNISQLRDFGFDVVLLDLRKYFGKTDELEAALKKRRTDLGERRQCIHAQRGDVSQWL